MKSDARKYITALYAEVDFNTKDMEIFIVESVSITAVISKVKTDLSFIPHITDARHTYIYSDGLTNLHHLGGDLIGDVVYFYGLLEKLRNQVAGIYLPSFLLISGEGRGSTIHEIWENTYEIRATERKLLEALERRYPDYKLARTERNKPAEGLPIDELAARHRALASDLDRVNAKHA